MGKCLGHKRYNRSYRLIEISYCFGGWCQDPYYIYDHYEYTQVKEKPIKISKTKAILLEELKEAIAKIKSTENSLKERETLLDLATDKNLELNKNIDQYKKDISEKDKTIASLQKDLANYNKNPTNGSTRFGVLEID